MNRSETRRALINQLLPDAPDFRSVTLHRRVGALPCKELRQCVDFLMITQLIHVLYLDVIWDSLEHALPSSEAPKCVVLCQTVWTIFLGDLTHTNHRRPMFDDERFWDGPLHCGFWTCVRIVRGCNVVHVFLLDKEFGHVSIELLKSLSSPSSFLIRLVFPLFLLSCTLRLWISANCAFLIYLQFLKNLILTSLFLFSLSTFNMSQQAQLYLIIYLKFCKYTTIKVFRLFLNLLRFCFTLLDPSLYYTWKLTWVYVLLHWG